MKLSYYQGDLPNFGDDLNPYIWSQIMPAGFLDDDENELFLGIGSILWDGWPTRSTKHVMGSGYGGYGRGQPNMSDGTWNPVFVRGPRTARTLGLAQDKAICDGALLLRYTDLPNRIPAAVPVFIPHFQSLARGRWAEACELAGLDFVDPTGDMHQVLAKIRNAPLVITEAMHGAIVADALRTPWIALRPIHKENRMKWYDWSESLDIDLRWRKLLPSSMMEAYIMATKTKKKFGPRALAFNRSGVLFPFNAALTYTVARQLSSIARLEPQLSADGIISRVSDRARETVDLFCRGRSI